MVHKYVEEDNKNEEKEKEMEFDCVTKLNNSINAKILKKE